MKSAMPEEFPRSQGLLSGGSLTAGRNSTEWNLRPEIIDAFEDKLRRTMHLDRDLDQVGVHVLGLFFVAVPGVHEAAREVGGALVLAPVAEVKFLQPVEDRINLAELVGALVVLP